MALLGLVVVVGDLRPQLDLADVDLLLVLAGCLRLLLLLVLVLRVVEQAGDRRLASRARPRPGRGRAPGRVCSASSVSTIPTCSPSSSIRRTCGTRIRSLIRVGVALGRAPVEPARDRHYEQEAASFKRTKRSEAGTGRSARGDGVGVPAIKCGRSIDALIAPQYRRRRLDRRSLALDPGGELGRSAIAPRSPSLVGADRRPRPPPARGRRRPACRGTLAELGVADLLADRLASARRRATRTPASRELGARPRAAYSLWRSATGRTTACTGASQTGKRPRVVLDQDPGEALHRAEQGAVDHHRPVLRRCRRPV